MQLHASFGSMLAVTGVVMFLHQGCIEDDAVRHKRSMQAAEKKATAITQVYTRMNSKGRN